MSSLPMMSSVARENPLVINSDLVSNVSPIDDELVMINNEVPIKTNDVSEEPSSREVMLERTLSPTQRRPRSPYKERANSPFKANREDLLHRIDPRKLSYERSTIYNDVYSTNDLIFLLTERGIEAPRSKVEMVDILYNFI
jgi:hypothetical protein